jgi:hypothetical protein
MNKRPEESIMHLALFNLCGLILTGYERRQHPQGGSTSSYFTSSMTGQAFFQDTKAGNEFLTYTQNVQKSKLPVLSNLIRTGFIKITNLIPK